MCKTERGRGEVYVAALCYMHGLSDDEAHAEKNTVKNVKVFVKCKTKQKLSKENASHRADRPRAIKSITLNAH